MVEVAIEEPPDFNFSTLRTSAGIDAARRLTNSQKAEFIVHPATGGTSPGQKRDWRVYDFVARRDVLSAFLRPFSISLRYIVVNATLWHITAGVL